MRRLFEFYLFGILLMPGFAAQAQTPVGAGGAATSAAAQAPDEMTKKIADLVHTGKYADAQQLTAGLLIVYPNDQRLIKAKALIERLLAGGDAAPAPANAATAAPAKAVEQLTGEDKLDYGALIELARQAQQSTDLDQQTMMLHQFMEQSRTFLQRHPEQILIWQLRAAAAISLQEPIDGYEAGEKLLAMGAMDSNDVALQQLLSKLKLMGWLEKDRVNDLQLAADQARKQQAASAEADRLKAEHDLYTFPVAHANGFHYAYGHLTINERDAVYTGSDETVHMLKSEMREVRSTCFAYMCGLYFTPKKGPKYFLVAITAAAEANRTDTAADVLPAAVLGNAVVARWKFVASADNKTLLPPAEAGSSTTPAAHKPAMMNAAPAEPDAALVHAAAPAVPDTSAKAAATETAVLHVYRPHRMTASIQKPDIYVDGKKIAPLQNAHVVRVSVAPGKHTISVYGSHFDNKAPLDDVAMEAGQEYWVRMDFDSGAFGAHAKLVIVPAAEAAADCRKMDELRLDEVAGR